jgi:hypothetical protein
MGEDQAFFESAFPFDDLDQLAQTRPAIAGLVWLGKESRTVSNHAAPSCGALLAIRL